MKRILVITFIIILSSINVAFSQFPNPPISGLVAYYPFNGNANDVSVNGNNGTINGGVTFVSDRLGNANSAAYFNGINGWINIPAPNTIKFNTGVSYSIVATVKLEQNNGTFIYGGSTLNYDGGTIFSRYGCPQSGGGMDGIIIDFSNSKKLRFGVNEFDVNAEANSNICNLFSVYHSIIAIRNASNSVLSVYIDGILKVQVPLTVNGSNNNNIAAWIGKNIACGAGLPDCDFLKGTIDDMAIYNRVLTPAEIAAFNFVSPVTIPNVIVNSSICQGSNYTLPNGTTVTSAGTYIDTLKTTLGCDSVYITTNLTVNPTYNITKNDSICQGNNYTLPNGTIVNTAGTYTVTLTSSKGCDSIITTNLTLMTSNTILIDQFTMSAMSAFSRTINVNPCENYYFTVSGIMSFFNDCGSAGWDGFYRISPFSYWCPYGCNYAGGTCPQPSYNPSHNYTTSIFTAAVNQLIFTFGDSWYGDNCGSLNFKVYHITCYPIITITNPSSYTICSDDNTNIVLTASIPSTFAWTIGTITGGITGASAGSGSTINQVLHNPSTTTTGSVQYIVTPTSISGGCVGLPFIITVNVNPNPNPSNIIHY